MLEHLTNTYNNSIDQIEERGYLVSTEYYNSLKDVESKNISLLKAELVDLTNRMAEAVSSGFVREYSETWYSMQDSINGVKETIQESETAIAEYNKTIRELKWDRFDYLQDTIGYITDESNFLIDLMESSDLFTDRGQFTDTGMSTMGLHGQNYNVYMAQADKYAEELLKLNEEITDDPNNKDLLDRREELLEAQRDSILAAQDEKDAIVDLVEEGISIELDALQDLIDAYEDALDTAKDLYERQKDIEDQAANIASLRKQLAAYSGDDSEETRTTIQKLKVELADAEQDLQETQYENYISDQKKILDELYTNYETILNERLDNVDALISDMVDTINANASTINETLFSQAENVGYTISESERSIWATGGDANSIITNYGDSFLNQATNVNDTLNKIAQRIDDMVRASDAEANSTISGNSATTPSTPISSASEVLTTTTDSLSRTSSSGNNFSEEVKKGVATAIWVRGGAGSGWGNDPVRKQRLTEKFGADNARAVQDYINANANNGNLYKNWVSMGKGDLARFTYSAFKNGGLADYTGMAWMDGTPSKPEMVLNSKDTSNFVALKDAMQSVAAGDSPLADILNGDGSSSILSQLSKLGIVHGANGTSVGDISYNINIPIEHVQDYDDFVNQLKSDGKFEKMIQSMTVDRLTGGTKMSKNKYSW